MSSLLIGLKQSKCIYSEYHARLLSDVQITTMESAKQAMTILHGLGVSTVIITSAELVGCTDYLYLFVSHSSDKDSFMGYIQFPKVGQTFTGTGDLFAALLLARINKMTKDNLITACEKAVATMQDILCSTQKAHEAEQSCCKNLVASKELRILQSPNSILNPTILYRFISF
jgi:pyridoxine kinase